jgi:DNA processing protein
VAQAVNRDLQAAARRAGGAHELWECPRRRLPQVLGHDEDVLAAWTSARRAFSVDVATAELARHGAWWSAAVPSRLGALVDPPFGLVGRGEPLHLEANSTPIVAIVGSRRPTARGLNVARALASDLSNAGAVVVSGLALGIDAAAHEGALDAHGRTIAVLGSSVDNIAPRTNGRLAERIVASGGSVVSEYWFGTSPAPWRFPARNRVVAGIADAVIVVEAAERSGALITADFALDLGRSVLAVPGPAGATMSQGCHNLLRAGAALCERADDAVAELDGLAWKTATETCAVPDDAVGRRLLDQLRREPQLVDELAMSCAMSTVEIVSALGRLEIDGLVARDALNRYSATG